MHVCAITFMSIDLFINNYSSDSNIAYNSHESIHTIV
jgi:hypothetical protein